MAQQRINVQAPIERLFAERWSTRAFDSERPVDRDAIASCLEAARWAPSCFGEEPWRYIVADRFADAPAWNRVVATLAEKNQLWAKNAPVLIVSAAEPSFSHNGKPNRWAEYDTGQATVCLCLQATAQGLASHQMGGFDSEALKAALDMPDQLHVMSVTAIGYPGDVEALAEDFQPMETTPRTRKPMAEIAHAGCWDMPVQTSLSGGWEARYQETPSEQLPWFHTELDQNIASAIEEQGLTGGRLLDLGCGPGTQSVALAALGFDVTASDVSETAVASARKLAQQKDANITFYVDDILHSSLTGPFDVIVDRGIFHCFADAADQQAYLTTIHRLLRPEGMLLLKCFHQDETREQGPPGRYGEADIRHHFADRFELIKAHACRFSSSALDEPPKALFCILKRNKEK